MEIIIVDDGSTDSTSDICDDYGNRFDNVSVFHQPNSGPGIANNCGLDHARGEYIWFLDSDDYLVDNAISIVRDNLADKLDILLFGATSFSDGAEIIRTYNRTKNLDTVMPREAFLSENLQNHEYYACVSLGVFHKEFLDRNELRFGSAKYYEDEYFSFSSLIYT